MVNKYIKKMLTFFSNQKNTNQDHNEINILHSVKLTKLNQSDNNK